MDRAAPGLYSSEDRSLVGYRKVVIAVSPDSSPLARVTRVHEFVKGPSQNRRPWDRAIPAVNSAKLGIIEVLSVMPSETVGDPLFHGGNKEDRLWRPSASRHSRFRSTLGGTAAHATHARRCVHSSADTA